MAQTFKEKKQVEETSDESEMVADPKKGSDELYEMLKELIPRKVKMYAGYGRDEAGIYEFRFDEGIKFAGCYAKDLLMKGNVIKRLQNTWIKSMQRLKVHQPFLFIST